MLELLATVDPLAAILGSLYLFAAGLFPLGLMLGTTCGGCCLPCTQCTEGKLPKTLTVTFSGLADKTPGPDLISVTFSSCYGSGAAAKITLPEGEAGIDNGPISAVELTKAGSGYAKLGRVEPTLTITGSGSGANFTPTLTKSQDACGIDRWAVSSVSVTGGTGYTDGETLSISVASGDTEEQPATAIVHTKREEPTLSVEGDADLTLTYNDNLDGTWGVDESVTVNDGGTIYTDGQQLTITLGAGDVEESAATLIATTGRIEPTVVAYFPFSSGTGAVITPTLTQTTDGNGKDIWETSSLTITAAGTGYAVDDTIYGSVTDGQMASADLVAVVSSVDGNGAITGVAITQTGTYFKSDGIIQSVEVLGFGRYYKDTGEPDTVEVTDGGIYYREDPDESPYVATVTVTVTDSEPSDGNGAQLSATIDVDTSSGTFGQITAVSIDNGGNGYLARELYDTCLTRFDGRSIVVKRQASDPCLFSFGCLQTNCSTEQEQVSVRYRGPSDPLEIQLSAAVAGLNPPSNSKSELGVMQTTANPTSCSGINLEAEAVSGVPEAATATVVEGGEYVATDTCQRLELEELQSITVSVQYSVLSWEADLLGGVFPCGELGGGNFANYSVVGCGSNTQVGFNVGAEANPEGECEPFQSIGVQGGSTALELRGCRVKFADLLVRGSVISQSPTPPHLVVFSCQYDYLATVPQDEEGYPSGACNVTALGLAPGSVGTCGPDPGAPSISFSRLP